MIIPSKYHGFVGTREIAEYFGVSQGTVRKWFKRKLVKGSNPVPYGRYLVNVDEIDQFEKYLSLLAQDLKRYLPRELLRQGIRGKQKG